VKSVDVVDVIREVGDLESQVVSGLVDASDGGGVHVLVAFHVGRFMLFKQHGSIKVAYATATVGREERMRQGGRVSIVVKSRCHSCLRGIAAGRLRADDSRDARVDLVDRANAGQKVAGELRYLRLSPQHHITRLLTSSCDYISD
jgi:hypothetical protein